MSLFEDLTNLTWQHWVLAIIFVIVLLLFIWYLGVYLWNRGLKKKETTE